jgi:hypothetical protein
MKLNQLKKMIGLCLIIQILTIVNLILSQQCFKEDPTETEPVSAINSRSIPTIWLNWEYGAEIEDEPVHKEAPKVTTVNDAMKSKFKTPIDSFMMMCPISLWEVLVLEMVHYMEQTISKQIKQKRYFAGYVCRLAYLWNVVPPNW